MRGCLELPESGRYKERKEVAVSCPYVPEIGRNEGNRVVAVSFPLGAKNWQK